MSDSDSPTSDVSDGEETGAQEGAPQQTPTKKYLRFVNDPVGEKDVTHIPGFGSPRQKKSGADSTGKAGKALKDKDFKAKDVVDLYKEDLDDQEFIRKLKELFPGVSFQFQRIKPALKKYVENEAAGFPNADAAKGSPATTKPNDKVKKETADSDEELAAAAGKLNLSDAKDVVGLYKKCSDETGKKFEKELTEKFPEVPFHFQGITPALKEYVKNEAAGFPKADAAKRKDEDSHGSPATTKPKEKVKKERADSDEKLAAAAGKLNLSDDDEDSDKKPKKEKK